MKPDPQIDLVRRLRCAAGHLNGVIEMAEDGRDCEEVLHQLCAVETALRKAAGRLLTSQIQQSEAVLAAEATPTQRAQELRRLISLYSILARGPNHRFEASK